MRTSFRILVLLIAIMLIGVGTVSAGKLQAPADDISIGAQLYDKWYAALGVDAPAGNMPIWERQTSNTRSGPDTWRCSECHGWDYKGSEGAYATGSHATGFPNVMKLAAGLPDEEIIAHLKGSKDPSHDFSKYIDDANLAKLVRFLKEGVQDDSTMVDAKTLKAIGGNLENGKNLYNLSCAQCHGADGKQIVFRTEGVSEFLGSVANRDPYRFLHRTRFGVAGVKDMPVGYDAGWEPSDSVDVLAYAQSLPTGNETEPIANAGQGSQPSPELGGPQGLLGGIFTGIGAFFGMVGISILFLLVLVFIGAMIVRTLRQRR